MTTSEQYESGIVSQIMAGESKRVVCVKCGHFINYRNIYALCRSRSCPCVCPLEAERDYWRTRERLTTGESDIKL